MADTLLRFRDLKARGVVSNPVTLKRWQDTLGFPRGFMAGPNTRCYRESEVQAWLDSRPTENTTVKGAAKKRRNGGRS